MIDRRKKQYKMNAENILKSVFLLFFFTALAACGKNDSDGDRKEDALRISIKASPLETLPGPEHSFSVKVESKVPTEGIKYEVSVKAERDDQLVYYTIVPQVKTIETTLKLLYLPRQVICVCTIKAISVSNPDNNTKGSFRLVYK
jgi:hypothetical protein